ncbi:hypothetical protein KIPB_002627 [Kipferlia bialata]|uniref:Uncharacterized protein n=1 Tax=Kipferlia bialata TaxID=797122 RepID=A0A9K3CQY0_9EUKA|nr:hypothetical protein KIPB_002627 [Kipferlia bialata]|eukprot:g2627.t1
MSTITPAPVNTSDLSAVELKELVNSRNKQLSSLEEGVEMSDSDGDRGHEEHDRPCTSSLVAIGVLFTLLVVLWITVLM